MGLWPVLTSLSLRSALTGWPRAWVRRRENPQRERCIPATQSSQRIPCVWRRSPSHRVLLFLISKQSVTSLKWSGSLYPASQAANCLLISHGYSKVFLVNNRIENWENYSRCPCSYSWIPLGAEWEVVIRVHVWLSYLICFYVLYLLP